MNLESGPESALKVCDGNRAAAYGVLLSRPNVVASYPITPQTSLIEYLSQFKSDGLFEGEIVEVEGEISAMGVAIGGSIAGGRSFTATSSMGLYFMFDTYAMVPLCRLPVVMVNANRENHPAIVTAGQQDIVSVAGTGWIQMHTESCQEIIDTIIMSYRLAEDPEILLPVTVCYDGFYLSYLAMPVEIPPQDAVDRFLEKRPRPYMSHDTGVGLAATMISEELTEVRYRHQMALESAKAKIDAVDIEFGEVFGRSYGGVLEEYRVEDAEFIIITMGSHTGTARVAVDRKREQGCPAGLIKLRSFCPFPWERLAAVLRNKKAVGVIDRSVCFGWNCGHIFHELQTTKHMAGLTMPCIDFIGGLGGGDITEEDICRAIEVTKDAGQGRQVESLYWLALEKI